MVRVGVPEMRPAGMTWTGQAADEVHGRDCPRKTFTESVPQVPPRCTITPRLLGHAAAEVTDLGITPPRRAGTPGSRGRQRTARSKRCIGNWPVSLPVAGFSAEVNARLTEANSAVHAIDAAARRTVAGVDLLWIVECKYWARRAPQGPQIPSAGPSDASLERG
jgi:hypothetical protein